MRAGFASPPAFCSRSAASSRPLGTGLRAAWAGSGLARARPVPSWWWAERLRGLRQGLLLEQELPEALGLKETPPQLVVRRIFDTGERYEELHRWFAEEWKRGEAAWPAEVRAVFDELGLSSGLRRSLLESERFRQLLLEEQPLAKAA